MFCAGDAILNLIPPFHREIRIFRWIGFIVHRGQQCSRQARPLFRYRMRWSKRSVFPAPTFWPTRPSARARSENPFPRSLNRSCLESLFPHRAPRVEDPPDGGANEVEGCGFGVRLAPAFSRSLQNLDDASASIGLLRELHFSRRHGSAQQMALSRDSSRVLRAITTC